MGGEGGYLFNSSLPLPPASHTLTQQPGDYYRELTSAHSQQPDSNREALVCECKSLTTKLRALNIKSQNTNTDFSFSCYWYFEDFSVPL